MAGAVDDSTINIVLCSSISISITYFLGQIDVWGETTSSSNSSASAAVDLHVTPRVYDEVASRLRRSDVAFHVTINDLQRQAFGHLSGAREGRVRGSDVPPTPLKFGAEVRNCIWRFVLCPRCIYHLHLGTFALYCTNNQHDFKGWG